MRWAAIEAIQLHPGTAKIVDDKNVAKVAAARKLLTLADYGLRDGQKRALARQQAAA